jgi:hypothetical protein
MPQIQIGLIHTLTYNKKLKAMVGWEHSDYPFGIFKYFLVYIMTRIGYIPMKEIIIGTKLKLWNILSTVIYSPYADAAGEASHEKRKESNPVLNKFHWDVPLYIDDPKFGDYVDRICPFDLK